MSFFCCCSYLKTSALVNTIWAQFISLQEDAMMPRDIMNVLHLSPYLDSVPCLRTFSCDLGHHFLWTFHKLPNERFILRKKTSWLCNVHTVTNQIARKSKPELCDPKYIVMWLMSFVFFSDVIYREIKLNKAVRVIRLGISRSLGQVETNQ